MDDPAAGPSSALPSSITASRPTKPDSHHPEPINVSQNAAATAAAVPYDYTDNATPAEVEAVARERRATEGLDEADFMVGSLPTWDGEGDIGGMTPSSVTRTRWYGPGSRRNSVASRRSSSIGPPVIRRTRSSQVDLPMSPGSAVFAVESEDEGDVGLRRSVSRQTPGRGRRAPSTDYFGRDYGRRGDHDAEDEAYSPQAGPSSALGRLVSYIGLARHEPSPDEEAGIGRHATSMSSGRLSQDSALRSSHSDDGWHYGDDDDDELDENDESYSSSLADDTSLPPQSRPQSPNLPLVPVPGDGIFGDGARDHDLDEPKDFASAAVPSRQTVLLPDEDLSIRFTAYRTDPVRNALWWAGCVLTLGALGLIGRWTPRIWVRFCGKETAFDEAPDGSWLVVEVSQTLSTLGLRQTPYGDIHIVPIQIVAYPYPLSTVFPQPQPVSAPAVRTNAKDLVPDPERGTTHWEETLGFLKMVDYRYTRFVLDPTTGRWAMIRDWRDPKWTAARAVAHGLDTAVREQRKVLMGANLIDIASKSLFGLLMDEVLHPFYVFQIASIVLWSVDDYYYYAFAIALISAASVMSALVETKRTIERMREMSRFHCDVRALVDGMWQTIDCADLVPGDIFDASDPALGVFPCDALLLSGDAIVNESMLTGESVPVSKAPTRDEALRGMSREVKQGSSDVDPDLAKHYLFAGTKIIRVRAGARPQWAPPSEQPIALAMVTRTGFNTTKGALVRSMLFPKPLGFKFYRDSINFIGVLAIIAGLGFAVSAVQFIRIGIKWHTILVRALDLITIVVPPALPATLTIGTTFAIERLRKSGIFCISPNRVNIGGKVNVVCFDKTGTLTEDGLDVLGVRTIDRAENRFSELHSDVVDVPTQGGPNGRTPLLHALATCHALKLIDGEVIGDPLDIKMFEYTGWTLDEGQTRPVKAGAGSTERTQTLVQVVVRPPGTDKWRVEDAMKGAKVSHGVVASCTPKLTWQHAHFLELGVIRSYDFVSALRRMSVIVKRLKSSSMEIYCKGAPEVMADICNPSSFPIDYDDMLSYYTRNGFRVIAVAGKSIEGLTWLKAQRMRREVAESDLNFLGFIVFENKLKPGTAPNIHTLRAAHIACRMVTGDNVRTAISVARECGLISHSASVYIPAFGGDDHVVWSSVDDESHKLDSYTLKPVSNANAEYTLDAEMEDHDYQLALTGDVFRYMLECAPVETLQRMLVKGVIFARMSPDEKAELVERLQGLGYTVTFCGDGANDCGALKAADVGVSLSEAEASVAAPFTSRTPDISCVVEIIKEGRAALVTSFSCFKYMALYSLIQFTTVTLLYSFASSLGDFQFLYIDLFIIIPIAVAMGRTLPYTKIHPKRPTASLVSKKVLTSIIGQILINAAFQFFVFIWVRQQPWYTEPDVDADKLETFNYENTALFLISSFQYILVAAVFSVGPPYRKPMYTNFSLVACLLVLTTFSTYVLLAPSRSVALLLDIIDLPSTFKVQLLIAAVLNIAMCFAFERYAERPIARAVARGKRWMRRRRDRRAHADNHYKVIEGNMR